MHYIPYSNLLCGGRNAQNAIYSNFLGGGKRGSHGRNRMVVGFTTTYAISAYHH